MVKLLRLIRRHRCGLLKMITLSAVAVVCLLITNKETIRSLEPALSIGIQTSDVIGIPPASCNPISCADYLATSQTMKTTARMSSANPHPFRILLQPLDLCDNASSGSYPLAVIYVHSRPDNARTRDVIRHTWGNASMFSGLVRIFFVLGTIPRWADVQDQVKGEACHHNDILQEDFVDSYKNLTYKAIAALKWVTLNCARARYVIKVDDDVIVDTFSLIRVLSNLEVVRASSLPAADGRRQIWCRVWRQMKVQRTGKWRVGAGEYSGAIYPPYCSGMAYIMTSEAAAALYLASYGSAFFWVDDVYITGILSGKAGIGLIDLHHFFVLQPDRLLREKAKSGTNAYTPIFAHSSSTVINVPDLWRSVVELELRLVDGRRESPPWHGDYSTTVFAGKVLVYRSVSYGTHYLKRTTSFDGLLPSHQAKRQNTILR